LSDFFLEVALNKWTIALVVVFVVAVLTLTGGVVAAYDGVPINVPAIAGFWLTFNSILVKILTLVDTRQSEQLPPRITREEPREGR
jgi:hypothetical protein